MKGPIVNRDLCIDNGISGEHTALHALHHAFFNSRNKFSGDRTADNLVNKFKAIPALPGRDAQISFAILTASTALFSVSILRFCTRLNGLAVRYPRFAHLYIYAKFALQLVKHNRQMQLALSLGNNLSQFRVIPGDKARVFFVNALQSRANFVFVATRFGFYRHANQRVWKFDRLNLQARVSAAKRIARMRIL